MNCSCTAALFLYRNCTAPVAVSSAVQTAPVFAHNFATSMVAAKIANLKLGDNQYVNEGARSPRTRTCIAPLLHTALLADAFGRKMGA